MVLASRPISWLAVNFMASLEYSRLSHALAAIF